MSKAVTSIAPDIDPIAAMEDRLRRKIDEQESAIERLEDRNAELQAEIARLRANQRTPDELL